MNNFECASLTIQVRGRGPCFMRGQRPQPLSPQHHIYGPGDSPSPRAAAAGIPSLVQIDIFSLSALTTSVQCPVVSTYFCSCCAALASGRLHALLHTLPAFMRRPDTASSTAFLPSDKAAQSSNRGSSGDGAHICVVAVPVVIASSTTQPSLAVPCLTHINPVDNL